MATIAERPLGRGAETLTGGASAEVVGGIGAVVLAILGLANVAQAIVIPIAAIVLGLAFILESGAIAAEYFRVTGMTEGQRAEGDFSSGLSMKVIAGVSAIVLGILALIGLVPMVLMAVATVVFGASLMLSSATATEFYDVEERATAKPHPIIHGLATWTVGLQMVGGLATTVLGILALAGLSTTTVVLVAVLIVGLSILVSGPATTGKMFSSAPTWQ